MIKFLTMLMMLLMMSSTVSAYGVFWYDRHAGLERWKKVVIFPLMDANEPHDFLISRDETSLRYWENKYLMEQFEKKIKNMHTIRLAPDIKEKGEILLDKYSMLLEPFESEKARAEAVFEQTGADMYLIPSFRRQTVTIGNYNRLRYDFGTQSWVGDYDRNGDEHISIEGMKNYLNVMELYIKGYDVEGNEVLSFSDTQHDYISDEQYQFRDIAKYIRKNMEDIKSGKHDFSSQSGHVKVGFKDFLLPTNLSLNDQTLRGIYFALKVEALHALEDFADIGIVFDGDDPTPLNYYVTGELHQWNAKSQWRNASAGDRQVVGRWVFSAYASMNLQLVDARTGTAVIEDVYAADSAKIMDAYRLALEQFYAEVAEYFKATL